MAASHIEPTRIATSVNNEGINRSRILPTGYEKINAIKSILNNDATWLLVWKTILTCL